MRLWGFVGPDSSVPYVHDGTVYVVGCGRLRAVSVAGGFFRWSTEIGHLAPPTVSGDTVYLAGKGRYDGDKFFALDTADGRVRWRRRTSVVSLTPPVVADGLVHHVDGSRHLRTFDAATGRRRWRVKYRRNGANFAGPVLADGTLYVVDDGGTVRALDPATGAVRWQRPTSARVPRAPLVHDGTLYLGGGHLQEVYALDAATGELRWSAQPYLARTAFESTPAIHGDTLYITGSDHLYALNATTGEARWRVPADGGTIRSSPVVADGKVYLGSRLGQVCAISADNGQVRWKAQAGDKLRSLVVAGGLVYVTCGDSLYTMEA
ncbi:outer membrane protein assembly factor BamB family protein [Streptomyces guryensis]|uniref:PQQ-binding-like beta-propeller repeat protein n=1 Tax=Streptomyces guryensis TaxID=2886947 RepID=A0A9Q3VMK2_9ACTN|nr:PQQ-binding-like beta-propeller repeat protein [Streptomyces guryensis]MCD9876648.1 PQQ-binding-like beta-propeller repeat protein [Streptomyces guryensis]